jgi:phenylalanyl-tRNA synthetase beta chain
MPTISIEKELLFETLGRRYTDEEFSDLCFDFGIELDDVVVEEIEKTQEELDSHLNEKNDVTLNSISLTNGNNHFNEQKKRIL